MTAVATADRAGGERAAR